MSCKGGKGLDLLAVILYWRSRGGVMSTKWWKKGAIVHRCESYACEKLYSMAGGRRSDICCSTCILWNCCPQRLCQLCSCSSPTSVSFFITWLSHLWNCHPWCLHQWHASASAPSSQHLHLWNRCPQCVSYHLIYPLSLSVPHHFLSPLSLSWMTSLSHSC